MSGLSPLIKWPGGKARLASMIARHLPEHDTYVEPFAGGGAVFLRKPLAKKNVLGDKDRWSIEFFNDVRTGKLRKCRGGVRASRSLFDRSLRGKGACMKFALSTLSYHGDRSTFGQGSHVGKVMGRNKLRRLYEYEKKLKKAHLTVADFAKTMRRFDGKRTVHFLDPPWPLGSRYSENKYELGRKKKMGKAFDPHHVMEVCSKMEGGCFVIYGDHPSVRKAFKEARKNGWKVYAQPVSTNKGSGGMEKRTNLIAIKKPGKLGGKKRRRR